METLTIGCHAVARAAPGSEDRVLVIGLGPIGLAALEFVRLRTRHVTVMDRLPARVEFCRDTLCPRRAPSSPATERSRSVSATCRTGACSTS